MSTWILRRPALPTLAWWKQWRPEVSTETLVASAALFFTLACNGLFWRSALAVHPGSLRLAASLFFLLTGVHALLLGLLVWRWNARIMLTVLLLVSLAAAHYMGRYHIYLDADMLRNILATDRKESGELITPSLLWPLALAATPAWLFMPMPTIDTLQIFGSPVTSAAPVAGATPPLSRSSARG